MYLSEQSQKERNKKKYNFVLSIRDRGSRIPSVHTGIHIAPNGPRTNRVLFTQPHKPTWYNIFCNNNTNNNGITMVKVV